MPCGESWGLKTVAELKIVLERPDKNLTVLRLKGEFEGLNVLNAQEELLGYVRTETAPDLIVDFAEIEYIDSAAIGILLQMAKMASEKKMKFGILHVNQHIKKVLEVTRTDKIIKIYE